MNQIPTALQKGIPPQPNEAPLSAPALARSLAPGALSRVGEIALDERTDPRVVLTAAKLILWASSLTVPPDEEDPGGELCFSPEVSFGD